MSHPSPEELLDSALGMLADAEEQALRKHLQTCASCRAEAEALRREQEALEAVFRAPQERPAVLERRILDAVSPTPAPRRTLPMKTLALAATLLLAVVGGVLAFRDRAAPSDPVAQPDGSAIDVPPRSGDDAASRLERERQRVDAELAALATQAEKIDELALLQSRMRETPKAGAMEEQLMLALGEQAGLTPASRDALESFFEPLARDVEPVGPEDPSSTEAYDRIREAGFLRADLHPLSTFSIDVDRASYANVRRFIEGGQLPPPDAVRIEELVNAFAYADPEPSDRHPLAVSIEAASCPWNTEHRLVRIAVKGKTLPADARPASNLVFLVDVSGSMRDANKLPLLKKALRHLVYKLDGRDSVAIVVYAGAAGLVLEPTDGAATGTIIAALDQLQAGGSTNGGEGIRLAYEVARENFVEGGINRVILATDGDFNVGIADRGSLTRLIEEQARDGVFLSLLGFGMGNYKDATLEELSNHGDGNYAYIDSMREANKILGRELLGTLWTIARDVKLQIELNPAQVAGYRLIGYESRRLAAEDFNDDTKDAGDLGVGHSVVAFYEVVPASLALPEAVDPLKYRPEPADPAHPSPELLTAKLRYQPPAGGTSTLLEVPFTDRGLRLDQASGELKFSAAVAAFGLLLRDSAYKGGTNFGTVLELAAEGIGDDPHGDRAGFLRLVEQARELAE